MEYPNEIFRLVGCIPYSMEYTGFGLPIFCSRMNKNLRLMQYVDDISGKILEFRKVEYDETRFLALPNGGLVACGEDPIFSFIYNRNRISSGTLTQLQRILADFETENPKEIAINLQIRELIGTQAEKRTLRKRFRNTIYDSGDIVAANFFIEDSVLKTELWSLLVKFSPSAEITKEIMNKRSNINASINDGHAVKVDNDFLIALGYPVNLLEKINEILQFEFENTFKVELEKIYPIHSDDLEDQSCYENVIRVITKSSRQEERAAILLRVLSEDVDLGKKVLSAYNSDRGKFAASAIRKMSSLMIDDRPEHITNDRLSESIFEQLYKECFPMNQGAFLYLFARHFSQHPRISNAIIKKLMRGTNRYVEEWKDRIYHELNQISPRIYSDEYFHQTDIFRSRI